MSNNNNTDKIVSLSGLSRAVTRIREWVESLTHLAIFKYNDNEHKSQEYALRRESDQLINLSSGIQYAVTSTTATRAKKPLAVRGTIESSSFDGSEKGNKIIIPPHTTCLEMWNNNSEFQYNIPSDKQHAVTIEPGSPQKENYEITMQLYGDHIYPNPGCRANARVYQDSKTGEKVYRPVYMDGPYKDLVDMNYYEDFYIKYPSLKLTYTGEDYYDENGDEHYDKWVVTSAYCSIISEDGSTETPVDLCPLYDERSGQYEVCFLKPGDYVYFGQYGEYDDAMWDNTEGVCKGTLENNSSKTYMMKKGSDDKPNVSNAIPWNICVLFSGRYMERFSFVMDRYLTGNYDEQVSYVRRTRKDINKKSTRIVLNDPLEVDVISDMTGSNMGYGIEIILPESSETLARPIKIIRDSDCELTVNGPNMKKLGASNILTGAELTDVDVWQVPGGSGFVVHKMSYGGPDGEWYIEENVEL